MGYDMYCAVEAFDKKTKRWECFSVSHGERISPLFAKIADICNSEDEDTYIEPIAANRGLPSEITGPAEAWYDYVDFCCSATWLDRTELITLNKWTLEHLNEDLWSLLGLRHLTCFFDFKNGWNKAAFTRYSNLRVLFFFNR